MAYGLWRTPATHWSMSYGLWSMENPRYSLVYGPMASGLWTTPAHPTLDLWRKEAAVSRHPGHGRYIGLMEY